MAPIVPAHELFDLTGEVALVTGASSGLGERFAAVLAAHGARVIAAARRTDRLEELAARHPGIHPLALDVTRSETLAAALAGAEAEVGPLTILVNNAGMVRAAPFPEVPDADWESIWRTNVDAVWKLSQAFARRAIAAHRSGAIVNIASVLGLRVSRRDSAYAISKAAVVQMTHALALDLAPRLIRVNAIAPGYITTEMTAAYLSNPASAETRRRIPMQRIGDPCDLDGALLLLASPRASAFMTGSTIVVDGGHLLDFE